MKRNICKCMFILFDIGFESKYLINLNKVPKYMQRCSAVVESIRRYTAEGIPIRRYTFRSLRMNTVYLLVMVVYSLL